MSRCLPPISILMPAAKLCIVVGNMLVVLFVVGVDVFHPFLWNSNDLLILWARKDIIPRRAIKAKFVVRYCRTTKLPREEYLFNAFNLLACHTDITRKLLPINNLFKNKKMSFLLNRKLILIYITILDCLEYKHRT